MQLFRLASNGAQASVELNAPLGGGGRGISLPRTTQREAESEAKFKTRIQN